MINVLHLRDTNKVCGPGKTILETISRIDNREFNLIVGLFILYKEPTNFYFDEAVSRNIPIYPIRSYHQFDPSIIIKISKIIKTHNIHILHSHEYKSDLIALFLAKIHNLPVLTTIHGWITNSYKSKFYINIQKFFLKYFDNVIAVSERTRKSLLDIGLHNDRIKLIHNAIVIENYQPELIKKNVLRARYGLPKDAILIGNIGRLSPEKGQKEFINAAKDIIGEYRNVYFFLIGEGPDQNKLKKLVNELNIKKKVFFTGHIHDPRPYYKDLNIVALTSYTEGLPNVILEALSMETAIIATNVGGVNEILQNEVSGIIIPPFSSKDIVKGLKYYLDYPEIANMHSLNGKKIIIEKFGFEARVIKIQKLYKDIYNSRLKEN